MKKLLILMLGKVKCYFGRHHYKVLQEFNSDHRRIYCKRCSKTFAMSDDHKCVIPWDQDFENLYTAYPFNLKLNEVPEINKE